MKALIYFFLPVLLWSGCTENPKVYRVGILTGFPPFVIFVNEFKAKMAELGYTEGKNIVYDMPEGSLDPDEHRRVIKKFVADKVDLIFVFPTGATVTAREASQGSNIPILFVMPDDISQSSIGWRLIKEFADRHKVPVSGASSATVYNGAVFNYAPEITETGRLAAPLADTIFKGTPAGSIPVVTPEACLAFNYKLAQQLGLTVPEHLLRMAKEIIR